MVKKMREKISKSSNGDQIFLFNTYFIVEKRGNFIGIRHILLNGEYIVFAYKEYLGFEVYKNRKYPKTAKKFERAILCA